MSYKRITIASGTPVTDETIDYMKNTNMPAVRAMGATDCEIVQTGPDSAIVIATYPDKAAADAAAAKAAASCVPRFVVPASISRVILPTFFTNQKLTSEH